MACWVFLEIPGHGSLVSKAVCTLIEGACKSWRKDIKWDNVPTGPHLSDLVCGLVVLAEDVREIKSIELGIDILHFLDVSFQEGVSA